LPRSSAQLASALIGILFFATAFLLLAHAWRETLSEIAGGGVVLCKGPGEGLLVALPGAEGQGVEAVTLCRLVNGSLVPAVQLENGAGFECPPGSVEALVEVSAPLGWPRASATYSCGRGRS
jgi:hypothetical protein